MQHLCLNNRAWPNAIPDFKEDYVQPDVKAIPSVYMPSSPLFLSNAFLCLLSVHAAITQRGFLCVEQFPFINRVKVGNQTSRPLASRKVMGAPIWLVKRMEALQQRPPPTLQDVETSFRAAEASRAKSEDNPRSYTNGRNKPIT